MPMKDLVSIIIPTYNRGYCLPATIRSAFAQTYPHIEIIVIDDGSTDGTQEILEKLWPNEPRLRYFRQPNSGASVARNLGFSHSQGEFIALLDSDDFWAPWKTAAQVACMRRYPDAVMVHSEMEGIDKNGRVFDSQYLRTTYEGYKRFKLDDLYSESTLLSDFYKPLPESLSQTRVWYGDIFSHMLTGNLAHTSTILMRKTPSGGYVKYNDALRIEETFDFHLRIAHSGPVVFLDAPSLSYQRGGDDHIWSADQKLPPEIQLRENLRYLQTIEPFIKNESSRMRLPRAILNRTLSDAHAWIAESAMLMGKKSLALRHMLSSLRLRPWQPRRTLQIAKDLLKPSTQK